LNPTASSNLDKEIIGKAQMFFLPYSILNEIQKALFDTEYVTSPFRII